MVIHLEGLNKVNLQTEQPQTAALQADAGWTRPAAQLVGGAVEPHGARTVTPQPVEPRTGPVNNQTFAPTNNQTFAPTNTVRSDATATSTSSAGARANATGGNAEVVNNNTVNSGGGGARTVFMPGVIQSAPSLNGAFCQDGKSFGVSAGWLAGLIGISGGETHPNQQCLDMQQAQARMAQACAQEVNRTQMTIALGDQQMRAGRHPSVAGRADFMANQTALGALRMSAACDAMTMGTPLPDILKADMANQVALRAQIQATPMEAPVRSHAPHPVHRPAAPAHKKDCP